MSKPVITNIFIDNQANPVSITSVRPVFSWVYTDTDHSPQLTYEIRVGTSDSAFGTDLFVGDKWDSGIVTSNLTLIRYPIADLLRNVKYYIQIRVQNTTDQSAWGTATLKINSLPTVSNAQISPSPVYSGSLMRAIYTFKDIDGDSEATSRIRWYKNSVLETKFNDFKAIEPENLIAGDKWYYEITPYDGKEYGALARSAEVTIQNHVPSAVNAVIVPSFPRVSDKLKASYLFLDDDGDPEKGSEIRWFRNNQLQPHLNDAKEVSSDLIHVNDSWYFTVQPSDGVGFGQIAVSNTVIVTSVKPQVTRILIDNQKNPTAIDNRINPIISWEFVGNTAVQESFHVIVGTTPSGNDVWDSGVVKTDNQFAEYGGSVLDAGAIYYISVKVFDGYEESDYTTIKMTTYGSLWQGSVDNAIGWTVEFRMKIRPFTEVAGEIVAEALAGLTGAAGATGASGITGLSIQSVSETTQSISGLTGATSQSVSGITGVASQSTSGETGAGVTGTVPKQFAYQAIEIHDGTKMAALRITDDRIELLTNKETLSSVVSDVTYADYNLIRITGRTNNISVFVNGILRIDGTGKLNDTTEDKRIEFGDTPYGDIAAVGYWDFIRYSILGSFEPATSENFIFEAIQHFPHETATRMISHNGKLYIGTNHENSGVSSRIFEYNDSKKSKEVETIPLTAQGVNTVVVDIRNDKWLGTQNGLSRLRYGKPYPWDQVTQMTEDDLSNNFDEKTNANGTVFTISDGILKADTSQELLNRYAYYEQKGKDKKWYNVSNKNGWTIETEIFISFVSNNTSAPGIYISDGARCETIFFFQDRITLKNAMLTEKYSLASGYTKVRIIGKGSDIQIYIKRDADPSYVLAVDGTGKFNFPAVVSGNASDIKIVEDNRGNLHAVYTYRDLVAKKTDIYHAVRIDGIWRSPVVISNGNFDSESPDIAFDSKQNIHIVWQDNQFGNYEIMHRIWRNGVYSDIYRVTNSTGDSLYPSIVVDTVDNIHLVWQDDRDNNENFEIYYAMYNSTAVNKGETVEGKWISSGFDDKDLRLTKAAGDSHFVKLAINSSEDMWAVWQDNRDNILKIFGAKFVKTENRWHSSNQIGGLDTLIVSGTGNAEHPDIATGIKTLGYRDFHLAWDDNRTGNKEIFYAKYNAATDTWTSSAQGGSDIQITLARNSSLHPAITVDQDNNLSIAWQDDRGTVEYPSIFLAQYDRKQGWWLSSNHGHLDIELKSGFGINFAPDIIFDSKGNFQMVWVASSNASEFRPYHTETVTVADSAARITLINNRTIGPVHEILVPSTAMIMENTGFANGTSFVDSGFYLKTGQKVVITASGEITIRDDLGNLIDGIDPDGILADFVHISEEDIAKLLPTYDWNSPTVGMNAYINTSTSQTTILSASPATFIGLGGTTAFNTAQIDNIKQADGKVTEVAENAGNGGATLFKFVIKEEETNIDLLRFITYRRLAAPAGNARIDFYIWNNPNSIWLFLGRLNESELSADDYLPSQTEKFDFKLNNGIWDLPITQFIGAGKEIYIRAISSDGSNTGTNNRNLELDYVGLIVGVKGVEKIMTAKPALPATNIGMLIGRFNNGTPFEIGVGPYEFTAKEDGVLHYGINTNFFAGNVGEFNVTTRLLVESLPDSPENTLTTFPYLGTYDNTIKLYALMDDRDSELNVANVFGPDMATAYSETVFIDSKTAPSAEAGIGDGDLPTTGVTLLSGQTVRIYAEGRISLGPNMPDVGPNGLGIWGDGIRGMNGYALPLSGTSYGCLVATFNSGSPFYIGSGPYLFTAPAAGTLRFSINDDVYNDNTGEFSALVVYQSTNDTSSLSVQLDNFDYAFDLDSNSKFLTFSPSLLSRQIGTAEFEMYPNVASSPAPGVDKYYLYSKDATTLTGINWRQSAAGELIGTIDRNQLLLWSKFENNEAVENPEIGNPGLVQDTPTYSPAVFGNGMRLDDNGMAAQYDNHNIDTSKGAFELMFTPLFGSGNLTQITIPYPNGVVDPSTAFAPLGFGGNIYQYIVYTGVGAPAQVPGLVLPPTQDDTEAPFVRHSLFYASDENNQNYIHLYYQKDLTSNGVYADYKNGLNTYTISYSPTLTAGTPIHLALVWDVSGSMAGDRLRLYENNVLQASSSAAITSFDASTVFIGNEYEFFHPANGIIDNVKIHAIPETVYTNYLIEDDHTTPIPLSVTLSGGAYSWAIGEKVHLRLVWNGDKSIDNIEMFVNGIKPVQTISGTAAKFSIRSFGTTAFFGNRDETGTYAGINALTHNFMLRSNASYGTSIHNNLMSLEVTKFSDMLEKYPEPILRFGALEDKCKSTSQWKSFNIYLRDAIPPLQIVNYLAQDRDAFVLPDAQDATLTDNFIVDMYYDEVNDSLWIATNNGISKYSISENIWKTYTMANGLGTNKITTIVMDKNGYVWAGTEIGLYRMNGFDDEAKFERVPLSVESTNPLRVNNILVPNRATSELIVTLFVQESNVLMIGTDAGFLMVTLDANSKPVSIELYNVLHGLNSNMVTAFGQRIDGRIIIGTDRGFSFFDRQAFIQFTKKDGLPSELITDIDTFGNDIWISTNAGILRMLGTQMRIFTARDGLICNSISGLTSDYAGYLWISTHAGVAQFKVDDANGNISIPYTAEDGIASNPNISDFYQYKLLTEPMSTDDNNVFITAYTNGILDETAYTVLRNETESKDFVPVISFNVAKEPGDIVTAVIYDDWREIVDFNSPRADVQSKDESYVRITDMKSAPITIGTESKNSLFISAETSRGGVVYELDDNLSGFPTDEIVMDRTPPEGTIKIEEFLGGNLGRVAITATDNLTGVDGMVVSAYPNFTSDGETPLEFQPYKNDIIFEFNPLASAFSAIYKLESGNPVSAVVYKGELYVGAKNPAAVYKFDTSLAAFVRVFTTAIDGLPNADAVLDMEVFDDKLFVSVSGTNRVFFFDGETWQQAFAFAYAICVLRDTGNILYMGSDGDGRIYTFDGKEVKLAVETQEIKINDIMSYSNNIYAGTSPNGRIYRFNGDLWEIIHADQDANILSFGTYGTAVISGTTAAAQATSELKTTDSILFAGTDPHGKILKYDPEDEIFQRVFHSVPKSINGFKTLDNKFYAVADETLFLYSGTNWVAQANNPAIINDIILFNQSLFIITNDNISVFNPNKNERCVHLKLKDRVGNITEVNNPDGSVKAPYVDCISDQAILDSITFKNQILEVDKTNKIIRTFKGDEPFLSADIIRREVGTYISDVFDGGNDLISWLELSWLAIIPQNTQIDVEFRAAQTSAEILTKPWMSISPFKKPGEYSYSSKYHYDYEYGYGYSHGYDYSYNVSTMFVADLSFVNNPFIQFRFKLISREFNVTPVLQEFTLTARKAQSVHFFTSNFALPENITRGLLTSNLTTPVNTQVVFGVGTDTSALFENYYIVEPNRIFELPEEYRNKNLKVGIKLVSSPQDIPIVDEFALVFELANNTLSRLNLTST